MWPTVTLPKNKLLHRFLQGLKSQNSHSAEHAFGGCLLLCKNNRHYERCIKQTPPIQFSILINDNDLRETDLHETSKRTALVEQTPNTYCLAILVKIKRSLSSLWLFAGSFLSFVITRDHEKYCIKMTNQSRDNNDNDNYRYWDVNKLFVILLRNVPEKEKILKSSKNNWCYLNILITSDFVYTLTLFRIGEAKRPPLAVFPLQPLKS